MVEYAVLFSSFWTAIWAQDASFVPVASDCIAVHRRAKRGKRHCNQPSGAAGISGGAAPLAGWSFCHVRPFQVAHNQA